jgi:hypothetical protein
MNRLSKLVITAAVAASSYAGFLAWRAHTKLVTLHVRNAPLAEVLSKLRWQTWEIFLVKTNVKSLITLDVYKMPLEQVLGIIGEQSNARWSTLYPIYRKKSSLSSLEQALRGEAAVSSSGFTNYGGAMMSFRPEALAREARAVTLHLTNTDLAISAMALERFGGGQVLVETNANPRINLELSNASFEKAVKKVASAAHRSTARIYALEGMRNGGLMAMGGRPGRGGPGRATDPDAEAQRTEKMEQVLQTLPEEERKKAEERQLERTAMQSLTPEQRQQVMSDRMNNPEMQARAEQRAVSGIKNTTPEQRRDRYERMYEMRKARAAVASR